MPSTPPLTATRRSAASTLRSLDTAASLTVETALAVPAEDICRARGPRVVWTWLKAAPIAGVSATTLTAAAAADPEDIRDIRGPRFVWPWLKAAPIAGVSATTLTAAAAADSEDIRDIRGPRFVWPGWLTAALIGVAATSLAATAAAPAADAEDIRDIRGPRFIWPGWLTAALIGGGVLLAVLGYLGWRWLRRRRRPRALLPYEAALKRLEDIRPLMQPHTVREFSIAASDIVRGYIELRFDVTATHLTTEEFLHDLLTSTRAGLLRHRALLAEFLQQCDLVKFAGMSLTLQSMESLHQSARAFVLETSKPDTDVGQSAAPPRVTPADGHPETHGTLPST